MRDFLSRPVASNLFKGSSFGGIIRRKEGYPPVQKSYTIMKKYREKGGGAVLSVHHNYMSLNLLYNLSLPSPAASRLLGGRSN